MKKRILILILSMAMLLVGVGAVMAFAETETEAVGDSFTPGYRSSYYEENYTISDSYKSSNVWIFDNANTNVGGYTNLIASNASSSALKKARSLLCTVECKDDTVTLVLNNNATVETRYDNEGQIMGNVIIDLNGYTIDTTAVAMINAQAKISDSSVYDSCITYKNGNIIVGDAGFFVCGVYGAAYDSDITNYKTMRYKFDNVNISFAEGTSCTSLVAEYWDNSTVGRVAQEAYNTAASAGTLSTDCPSAHMQYMGFDIEMSESCTIDLTNAPAGFTLFDACDPDIIDEKKTCTATIDGVSGTACYYFKSNCISTFRMNGGKIIVGENSLNWYKVNEDNGSYVKFGKGESGNYTTFSIPEESDADTSVSFASDDGELILIKSGSDTDLYNLVTREFFEALSGSTFTPKTSVTLDSNLIFNVYIPNVSVLNYFAFGEKEYKSEEDFASLTKKTVSGQEYYVIKNALDAAEAEKEFQLVVNIDIGETSANKMYTLSIPKYAAGIRAASAPTGNTKVLAADILSYVRAAYAHFDNASSGVIDSVLDADYELMSKLTVEGDAEGVKVDGIESVTFYLGATPAMRFYLAGGEDGSDYRFYINGSEIKTVYNEDGGYIETDVYAYQLCETVTYTKDGESYGSYHINSYYEYAKKLGDTELITLVERFWKYLQSARAYRNEFIGSTEYAHSHSYLEREIEMSAYTPHYSEKICACGYGEKTQYTGIEFGDKPVSVYFLGNSYTNYNNMSSMFGMIASGMGIDVDVTKTTKGGWHLWKYANQNDTGGKLFYADIENNDFDYAFIQDGSTQTLAAIAEFYDGVRLVGNVLEEDGAKVLLYQTWGRKEGHAVLDQYGLTTETMAYTVAAAYEAIAEETGYALSPAGSAFLDVYTNHPEIELYDADLTHPSATGSYLVALCHYATLFGRSPIGVTYTAGLDADTALILQTAAYNAVFGESIVPDSYKTSSEGVHVVNAENNLTAIPEGSELISVGITGDKGSKASSVTVEKDSELTAEQKLDMSDIGYGISIIGNKNMVTSLARATDGYWGSSRLSFDFDGNYYDITGDIDENEPYKALITYNFGGIVNITAIGYMSGNMDGFAQAQDVYVSNDGVSWSIVNTASYDAVLLGADGGSLHSLDTLPVDINSKTPGVCVAFDMNSANGGVYAKYVRFAIREGVVISNKSYDINTLELAVWGNAENTYISDIPEGSSLISTGLTASEEYSATVDGVLTDLTDAQKKDIADMTKYGMTLIGARTLARSIAYACNGSWSDSKRLTATFYDDNGNENDTVIKYDINGNAVSDGKYECLITYNFGEKVTIDAIGYMSGDMNGFAQNQEVWVSNDGVNWTKVNTACYDRISGDTQTSVSNKPSDTSGKTSGVCILFDMGGIKAQYVRVAVIDGMTNSYPNDMNTYELAVYGKKD